MQHGLTFVSSEVDKALLCVERSKSIASGCRTISFNGCLDVDAGGGDE